MKREDYRAAFDGIPFSETFQARTKERLRRELRRQTAEKETISMKRTGKTILLAAAVTAALVMSVSAVVKLLTPAQVAEGMEDPLLAEAFSGPDAVAINETVTAGEYHITLAGLVSGKNLSEREFISDGELQEDRTYVVVSMARADGAPLERESFPFLVGEDGYTLTPLVSGYPVYQVNSWTLDTGVTCDLRDGVAYFLLDTANLEPFADHTVYLAMYQGSHAPSNEMFTMAEDGSIAFNPGFEKALALFTLPLDASKADPAAVAALLGDFMPSNDDAVEPETPNMTVREGEDESGNKLVIIEDTEASQNTTGQ